jgi:UDPglucose--hexose-1-phosphate uridylyltransferase
MVRTLGLPAGADGPAQEALEDSMSVLRRDPTTGRWVVFGDPPPPLRSPGDPCPFCEGNESATPPEVVAWGRPERRPNGPGWQVRVVPNARPLLRIEGGLERHADRIYDTTSGTGAHEVVIETPRHHRSLTALPKEQVALVLKAWAERIRDLKRDARFRSIFVFKNQGVRAGAWLPDHAHSQIIGLPVIPKALKEILDGARQHFRLKERCVFCDLLREELEHGERLIQVTDSFVALAPYAARYPYEFWILPREHSADFESIETGAAEDLAALLVASLTRLEDILPEPAYNLFLYSSPNRDQRKGLWTTLAQDFHWHIQVMPRTGHVAGFEVGSGFYANPVLPEDAARMLRLMPPRRGEEDEDDVPARS